MHTGCESTKLVLLLWTTWQSRVAPTSHRTRLHCDVNDLHIDLLIGKFAGQSSCVMADADPTHDAAADTAVPVEDVVNGTVSAEAVGAEDGDSPDAAGAATGQPAHAENAQDAENAEHADDVAAVKEPVIDNLQPLHQEQTETVKNDALREKSSPHNYFEESDDALGSLAQTVEVSGAVVSESVAEPIDDSNAVSLTEPATVSAAEPDATSTEVTTSAATNEPAAETIPLFSDDDIDVSSQLSDSESDSDSSSESSSDSSDSDSDADPATKADLDLDDDEDEAAGGPIFSKNETAEENAPTLPDDYSIPENAPLEYVGNISGVVDKSVIIMATTSGEYRVLNEESVLCLEDRTVVGLLFEIFGRLQSPLYRVHLGSAEKAEEFRLKIGTKVFYVVPDAKFLLTDSIKHIKGTDASNCHDEELPVEEQEFSDDEQEQASKLAKKKKKRARKEGVPEPKKQHVLSFALYGYAEDANPGPGSRSQPAYPQRDERQPAQPIHNQPSRQPMPYGQPYSHGSQNYQSVHGSEAQNGQTQPHALISSQNQYQQNHMAQYSYGYPYPNSFSQNTHPYGPNHLPNKPLVGQLLHPVHVGSSLLPNQQFPQTQHQPQYQSYGQAAQFQPQFPSSHQQNPPVQPYQAQFPSHFQPQFQNQIPQQQANPAQLQQLQQLLLHQLQNQNQTPYDSQNQPPQNQY